MQHELSMVIHQYWIIIMSYIVLNFFNDRGTKFFFIVNLYFETLNTIVNTSICIFIYIPIHTINLIIISFPTISNEYLQTYKTYISGPFSKLFPKFSNLLSQCFPLFKKSPDFNREYITNGFQYFHWIKKNKNQYLLTKYIFLSLLFCLIITFLEDKIKRLFKSRLIRTWFYIFSVFLLWSKYISIRGPGYKTLAQIMKNCVDFHIRLYFNIINKFVSSDKMQIKTADIEKNDSLLSKSLKYFPFARSFIYNAYKNRKKEYEGKLGFNLDFAELFIIHNLNDFIEIIFDLNGNLVRQKEVDFLFILFIYSFILSLIIQMLYILYSFVVRKTNQIKNDKEKINEKDIRKAFDTMYKKINLHQQFKKDELGYYMTCFFAASTSQNYIEYDLNFFIDRFQQLCKKSRNIQIGKCKFDGLVVAYSTRLNKPNLSKPIIEALQLLFSYSTLDNDDLLFYVISQQLKTKFEKLDTSYFEVMIPYLMKRHNINLINEVCNALHSNKNISNISLLYRFILESITRNDANARFWDQKWIENEICAMSQQIVRSNKLFFDSALLLFNEPQIIELFRKLQEKEKFAAIAYLISFLYNSNRKEIINKLKTYESQYHMIPTKYQPIDDEEFYFKMIVKF